MANKSGNATEDTLHDVKVAVTDTLVENGSMKVAIQDQHSFIISNYLDLNITDTTLTSGLSIDATVVNVAAGHGAVAGDLLCITEGTRCYQAIVISVATNALTVDTPLDYAFTTAALVHIGEHDMATNGAVATQIYSTGPPAGVTWDITRIMMYIEDGVAMDGGTFGGIPALTNGIVLRKKNGTYQNVYNVKTNGELAQRAYDVRFDDKAPAGAYSLTCRTTFAGQEKHGVTIRLDGDEGDELQVLIQDDLSGLSHFHIIAQGHVVV